MEKPFVFGIPATGDYFTDRVKETRQLALNFTYGVNTILISPRRWGKTSLVDRAIGQIADDKVRVVKMDIFACRSDMDFYSRFATEVVRQTSTKLEEWVNCAKRFLSRLTPKFSFGADPMTDFSMSFEISDRPEDVEELLWLPEKIAEEKGLKIVVCIDEFQQIGEFADTLSFQKRLRSVWQHQKLTSYCLFGSKRHMMHELFGLSTKPFYKFGEIINLNKIPAADWIEYIKHKFEGTGKSISDSQADKICQLVECNSSYVQQLSWVVWTISDVVVSDDDVEEAYVTLLEQNGPLFEKATEELTAYQLGYLRAMADGISKGFTTQAVIRKYKLGSSANVKVIQLALQKKEIIYTEGGQSIFCDPLLPRWLKLHHF